MAGDWIKVRTVLPNDGRLKIAAKKCHASSVTVLGALVTLWCLADSQADAEGVLVGYDKEDIDQLVRVPGFCDSLPADWIDLSSEWVKLPEYEEHNGSTAKSRAQSTKRKRHSRGVTDVPNESRSERDKSVTREEKRREEKKEPIKKKPSAKKISFAEWQASIPEGEEAFPLGHYVHQYVADVGLPEIFQDLAWFHFSATFAADASKKQADWPRHFRNALKGNWCKAWWINDQGEYCLTTVGKQLQKQMEAA